MNTVDELKAMLETEVSRVAEIHARAQDQLNAMQQQMAQFHAQAEAEINRRNGRVELLKEMIKATEEGNNG